jgi:hypothetical protein
MAECEQGKFDRQSVTKRRFHFMFRFSRPLFSSECAVFLRGL